MLFSREGVHGNVGVAMWFLTGYIATTGAVYVYIRGKAAARQFLSGSPSRG
jgi:hypothetical protein